MAPTSPCYALRWRQRGRRLAQVGFHERVEVAVEHSAGVAGLVPRAQVFDQVVGVQDVVADLAAPPRADVLAFELRVLALARFLFALQQARLENTHSRLTVLQLRALVLAGHDDAARQVRDAHGRADLVDVLPARAAGPVGVDLDVFGVDRYL